MSQPSRSPEQVLAQGLGACLTQANLEDIKRFVEDFAVRALLPAMEARVRALNHQVIHPRCSPGSTQTWCLSPSMKAARA